MIETKTLDILKNIKTIFLAVLLTKSYVLMINIANQLFFIEEKMQSINLLKQFWKIRFLQKSDEKTF